MRMSLLKLILILILKSLYTPQVLMFFGAEILRSTVIERQAAWVMVLTLFHFGRLVMLVSILTATTCTTEYWRFWTSLHRVVRWPGYIQDAELRTGADTACCERDGVTCGPRRHPSCRRAVEDYIQSSECMWLQTVELILTKCWMQVI